MFITTRGSKCHLTGHCIAKLHKHQLGWIPCELEVLAITAAVSHFNPNIIQSKLQSFVLTDSKPSVDGFVMQRRLFIELKGNDVLVNSE